MKRILHKFAEMLFESLRTLANTFLSGGAGVKWDGDTTPHDPLAKRREKHRKQIKTS